MGLTLTSFLAARGATVFMVCRSRGRAEAAKDNVIKETGNEQVKLIVADMVSVIPPLHTHKPWTIGGCPDSSSR